MTEVTPTSGLWGHVVRSAAYRCYKNASGRDEASFKVVYHTVSLPASKHASTTQVDQQT